MEFRQMKCKSKEYQLKDYVEVRRCNIKCFREHWYPLEQGWEAITNLCGGRVILQQIQRMMIDVEEIEPRQVSEIWMQFDLETMGLHDSTQDSHAGLCDDFNHTEPSGSNDNSASLLDRMSTIHEIVEDTQELVCESSGTRQRVRHQRSKNPNKNETKNIPKNFGKGIISFIERNEAILREVCDRFSVDWQQLLVQLKFQKKNINTIADLRDLWTNGPFGKCLRILSNMFFRKYALHYIFNSRISNYASHIKYRQSLWQAIGKPDSFNHIKEF